MSPRRIVNEKGELTEAAWQSQVFGLLRFYGWRFHHAPDNRPVVAAGGRAGRQHVGDKGFPDVVATRHLAGYRPELIFAELKTNKGRYGPGQLDWLIALEYVADTVAEVIYWRENQVERVPAPAIAVYTWRPRDRDQVEEILAGPEGVGVLIGTVS